MSVIAGWLFGKLANAALSARQLEPLEASLTASVAEWRDSLPSEYQDQDYWHDLFTSYRRVSTDAAPKREALAAALRERVPTVGEWLEALVECWRAAHAQSDVVAFFRVDESVATPYLRKLASALHASCAKELALAIPTLLARDPQHAPLSALADYLARASMESRSRLVSGWQAAGVAEHEATAFARDPNVGVVPVEARADRGRRIVLLVGELGVGKSVVMERLFTEQVVAAQQSDDPIAPVRLKARTIIDGSVELAIGRETAAAVRGDRAVVFIEDIDEYGSEAAVAVLREARAFIQRHTAARVVATCRPGVVEQLAAEAVVWVPPLDIDSALALVARIGGCSVWNARSMIDRGFREEARRPLFAILLGLYWRDIRNQPKTLGELIAHLVDAALGSGVPSLDRTASLLQRLAALVLDCGGPVKASEVAGLLESRQIRQSRLTITTGDAVEFALPILAQWFGAEALGSGIRSGGQLAKEPSRLERWRTSLTIAAATFSFENVTPLLDAIAKVSPALTAIVVKDAIDRWADQRAAEVQNALECGRRIRGAMRAWVDALGPTAELCGPARRNEPLPALCVHGKGNWLTVGWYRGTDAPAEVFSSAEYPTLRPERVRGSRPARQPAWAWRWTLEELADGLRATLKRKAIPFEGGPQALESAWVTLLTLTRRGELFGRPVPRAEFDAVLAKVAPEQRDAIFAHVAVLATSGDGEAQHLVPPWPAPDLTPHGSGFAWGLYSPERLRERVTAIYRAALDEYVRVVDRWFPSLRSRMPMAMTLPARVVGELGYARPELGAVGEPWLAWRLEPLARLAQNDVAITLAPSPPRGLPETDDELRRELDQLAAMRPEGKDWMAAFLRREALRVYHATPATDLLYRWLSDDLNKAGWLP